MSFFFSFFIIIGCNSQPKEILISRVAIPGYYDADGNKVDEECMTPVLTTGPIHAMLKAREMGMLGRRRHLCSPRSKTPQTTSPRPLSPVNETADGETAGLAQTGAGSSLPDAAFYQPGRNQLGISPPGDNLNNELPSDQGSGVEQRSLPARQPTDAVDYRLCQV